MSSCWSSALLSAASKERFVQRILRQPTFDLDKTPPKTAAVLIPLCIVNDVVSLLYTLRSSLLKNYSGQVSFPGGMTDSGETPVQTALREAEEELGLPRDRVEVWCTGHAFPGRNFEIMVTPVFGFIPNYDPAELRPRPEEVEKVFTVPIHHLCEPQNQGYTKFKTYKYIMPVFTYDNHKIWGLTAFMTHMFLQALVPKDHYSNNLTQNRFDPDEFVKLSKL